MRRCFAGTTLSLSQENSSNNQAVVQAVCSSDLVRVQSFHMPPMLKGISEQPANCSSPAVIKFFVAAICSRSAAINRSIAKQ